MRHDYDLPSDYRKRVEEGTMDEWFKRERTRRRAMNQDTNWCRKARKALERHRRRAKARSETTDVER